MSGFIPEAGQMVRITGRAFSPDRRVERMPCLVVAVGWGGVPNINVCPIGDMENDDMTGGKWWFRLSDIEHVELLHPGDEQKGETVSVAKPTILDDAEFTIGDEHEEEGHVTIKSPTPITQHVGKKYLRTIVSCVNGESIEVDVYAVLEAFAVTCPARQHAIKKLLCAGLRNKGSQMQDLDEAINASGPRVLEMQAVREKCQAATTNGETS